MCWVKEWREFQKVSKIRTEKANGSSLGTTVRAVGAEMCLRKSYYNRQRTVWGWRGGETWLIKKLAKGSIKGLLLDFAFVFCFVWLLRLRESWLGNEPEEKKRLKMWEKDRDMDGPRTRCAENREDQVHGCRGWLQAGRTGDTFSAETRRRGKRIGMNVRKKMQGLRKSLSWQWVLIKHQVKLFAGR